MQDARPAIDWVVFDLGRVLLRITDDWDQAARRAGCPELVGLTGDLSTKAARGEHHPLADLFDRFETGRVETDAFFTEAQTLTGLPAERLRRTMDAVLVEAYPGAAELLHRLAPLPVRTACLSNTNARHWALFTDPHHPSYLPLDMLDLPWGSQHLGLAKPDPAIYAHVESAANAKPESILFFDDIPENIDAAKQCGWHAERVSRETDNPIPAVTATLRAYGVLPAP
jgi:HAD superfamily hydrolase (TIGR01509 family)